MLLSLMLNIFHFWSFLIKRELLWSFARDRLSSTVLKSISMKFHVTSSYDF